ncbi:MAG: formate/nitrite transporter family protein [Lachnospiraceae bacterium]
MKLNLQAWKECNFLKSILAGIAISIGCICYLSVEDKVVGSFLFSVGLLAILQYGLNLYTGKIGVIDSVSTLIDSIIYLVGNMIGCIAMYFLIQLTPVYGKIIDPMKQIADAKLSNSALSFLILGSFCGMLIYFGTKEKKNAILTILCVMVFILCGFEHSIADSFYLLAAGNVSAYIKAIIMIAIGNGIGAKFVDWMANGIIFKNS